MFWNVTGISGEIGTFHLPYLSLCGSFYSGNLSLFNCGNFLPLFISCSLLPLWDISSTPVRQMLDLLGVISHFCLPVSFTIKENFLLSLYHYIDFFSVIKIMITKLKKMILIIISLISRRFFHSVYLLSLAFWSCFMDKIVSWKSEYVIRFLTYMFFSSWVIFFLQGP